MAPAEGKSPMLNNETLYLTTVVILCALCQSVVGVGLIMIGLPTLILSGYPFDHALSVCLPGSLIINVFQVLAERSNYRRADFVSYASISVIYAAFLFYLNLVIGLSFSKLTAGIILLLTGVVGFMPPVRERFLKTLNVRPAVTNTAIGVIHSISSLGGSLLSLTGTARYAESADARRFIAGGYLSLGMIQLAFYSTHGVSITPVMYSLIAVPAYFISRTLVTPYVNHQKLKAFIFFLILIYGALLIKQSM